MLPHKRYVRLSTQIVCFLYVVEKICINPENYDTPFKVAALWYDRFKKTYARHARTPKGCVYCGDIFFCGKDYRAHGPFPVRSTKHGTLSQVYATTSNATLPTHEIGYAALTVCQLDMNIRHGIV